MGTRFLKKRRSLFSLGDMKYESLDDVECTLGAFSHSSTCEEKFLNIFSDVDMRRIFIKSGLMAKMNECGFDNIVIDINRDSENIFYLKAYNGRIDSDALLLDLRMSERKYAPPRDLVGGSAGLVSLDVLLMEWLATSNPRGAFTRRRPQLPGQKAPGLGALEQLFKVMEIMGEEIKRDGVMNVPDHYHNAVFYSKKFRFIDPLHEGILVALRRDLGTHPLADVSWGFATGTVIDDVTGACFRYAPSEQVFPMSGRMREYFSSPEYQKKMSEGSSRRFRLEVKKMKQLRKDLLKTRKAEEL